MSIQPELHVDTSIYTERFPRFDKPKIIGYIDLENLKFAKNFHESAVRFDLNLLYEKAGVGFRIEVPEFEETKTVGGSRRPKAVHKPDDLDVKLTELLKFLLAHEARLNFPIESCLENARIHCYRGLMTLVACTPYENREPWKIVAILFKGNIYLCARDTEDKIQRKKNMNERERLFTSWGYKFEQYMLSDKPNEEPNPNLPVDETEEFSLVFTTNLNRHTVVYGAEMDGIRCDKGHVPDPPTEEQGPEAVIEYLSTKEFIELKTQRHIQHPNQEKSFRRFKAKKWWCQSFLVGIDSILGGLRNDDGIVEQLKLFPVRDLAKMSQKFWNPNICFNFLDNFFTYVKRCLSRQIRKKFGDAALNSIHSLPMITMMFEWNPGMPIVVNENYRYEDDPILPDWFVNQYDKGNR